MFYSFAAFILIILFLLLENTYKITFENTVNNKNKGKIERRFGVILATLSSRKNVRK